MKTALIFDFAPLLPVTYMYGLGLVIICLLILSFFFYRRGIAGRSLCTIIFFLLFLNPSLVEEKREIVRDVAVLVVDHSPSQSMGDRTARTDEAALHVKQKLETLNGLDVRVIDSATGGNVLVRETNLFEKIDQTLADIPLSRRAGIIMITDGQVHDVPQDKRRFEEYGPVQILLSGEKSERDRQLVVLEAPAYGIVGQDITIRYRIEDTDKSSDNMVSMLIRQDSVKPRMALVPANEDQSVTVRIDHAGQNIFDLEASSVDGELTQANNRVPLIINGVRDRLRVLLVSGQPHAGGRTWRNLLSSDPGVDLVHFTILREPDKLDATPQNELALIAFPFDELFDKKLYDFDLIIFDRYQLNNILPSYYFGNIARYVREGGALLEASGPSFANENSIYATELNQVLPAAPTGNIFEQPFKPAITDIGKRHPVTQNLSWPNPTGDNTPGWSDWLRQIEVTSKSGDTVMTGINDHPLLILDHVGQGRVAQLASDQIWLWSRGYNGGGPQAELLRRLAHWLMKEPELEENALDVTVDNDMLYITRRSLSDNTMDVKITAPDGTVSPLTLTPSDTGALQGRHAATQLGVYTVSDGTKERFALMGALNPPELSGVRTTDARLKKIARASKGGVLWLTDVAQPDIRLLPAGRDYIGRNWIGLRQNGSFNVTGIQNRPLLPPWAWTLALLICVVGSWWLEGRRKN